MVSSWGDGGYPTVEAIRRAFEDVEATFLPDDDGRLRADTSARK
jgi:hypothetical protein